MVYRVKKEPQRHKEHEGFYGGYVIHWVYWWVHGLWFIG